MLDHVVRVCLVFQEVAKLSSKVADPFCIPTSMNESSYCSTFLPVFGVVTALDFNHSNRCVGVSHCCFPLHFSDDI